MSLTDIITVHSVTDLCMCFVCHRLVFTVVSEPMDDADECVDVGQAFLELHELLLTRNDVIEQQIDSKCW